MKIWWITKLQVFSSCIFENCLPIMQKGEKTIAATYLCGR